MTVLLWLIVGVLVLVWLGGFILDVVGGLIHAVLVLAVVIAIANFVMSKRRSTT